MRVVIRQSEDLELVQELDKTCFAGTASVVDGEELNNSVWWVATLGSEPVGYIGLQFYEETLADALGFQMKVEEGCFFPRVGVVPAFRGGGLQKKLMGTMERYAKKQGVTRIFTYVWIGNIPSMRTIVGRGYKPYKWEWDENSSHAYLYLEKKL